MSTTQAHVPLEWQRPPDHFSLTRDTVHLWYVALDQPAGEVELLAHLLSSDEQARAQRFYFERDRRRFTVARGALRTILSRYVMCPPNELRFTYGPHGKPELSPSGGLSRRGEHVQFNLSHSQEVALSAVAVGRAVGIDLEYMRPLPDMLQLAQRFFSNSESEQIQALAPDQQQDAFFRIWTCKEACLKACGEGIAAALDQVEVAIAPDQPAQLLRFAGTPSEAGRWSLSTLIPTSGSMAALAVFGHDWQLTGWRYS